jgi:hypothetical protein
MKLGHTANGAINSAPIWSGSETQFGDGRKWLDGDKPSLIDVHAYMNTVRA